MKMYLQSVILFVLLAGLLPGQTERDAVRPFWGVSGLGSRANGLGQAYTGIADDFTALFYNPAGLAHLTRVELSVGLSNLGTHTNIATPSSTSRAGVNATRLNNLGLVIPVAFTKVTVAIGYINVRSFDQYWDVTVENTGGGTDHEEISIEGNLGRWSIGLGYQLSPNFSVGAGIGFIRGESDYLAKTSSSTGSSITTDNYQIKPNYSAFSATLGFLLIPSSSWRIGFQMSTPQNIFVDEKYIDREVGTLFYEYETRSSFQLRLGSSLGLGPVLLSGDIFWFDYSQIRFESDLVDEEGNPIDVDINNVLRSQYAGKLGYAFGGEYLLPGINTKIRAGYRLDPSIILESGPQTDQTTLAYGLSLVPVRQVRLDLTYMITRWEQDYLGPGADPGIFRNRLTAKDVSLNLSYRF